MTFTYRSVKGALLTAAEVDANFQEVETKYNGTVAAKNAAELARDKAEEWAENPEDVAVETGQYSAKHHALKAEASLADKADKDTDAVVDNLAVFDANGNPVDSGISKNLVYPDPAYTLDIQPTLNLDFANQAYRSHVPGTGLVSWPLVGGDSKLTVTRATTATYFDPMGVLRTAAAGVPRIDHDPATGECLGLLVEEQRANLLTYSEQFDNAAWSINPNCSVAASATTDPAGGTDAFTISATANDAVFGRVTTGTIGLDYAWSIWVRRKTGTGDIGLRVGDNSTQFITSDISSEWTRVWKTNAPTSTSVRTYVTIAISGDEVEIWGAQLEQAATPSSYIPTTTAAVTRNADVISMTGVNFSDWYNQSEGVVYVHIKQTASLVGVSEAAFSINTSINDRFTLFLGTPEYIIGRNTGGAGTILTPITGDHTTGNGKVSTAYATNDVALCIDGATAVTASSHTVATMSKIDIGHQLSNNYLNGHIKQLQYYPRRLTNTQLQALSA